MNENQTQIETSAWPAIRSTEWLDARGEPLLQGRVYKLANTECPNLFECVLSGGGTPNEEGFIRVHDGMKHRGREFIEFHNGAPYCALERI